MIRFLEKNEYARSLPLFTECFCHAPETLTESELREQEEFMEEFYGSVLPDGRCTGRVSDGRIAVLEAGSEPVSEDAPGADPLAGSPASPETGSAPEILSMVQVQFYRTASGRVLPYLMGVSTWPRHRHHGYMDAVMNFVLSALKEEGYPCCFLIAVDRKIYRHLDFVHDWKLSEAECLMLYADDGLDTASACLFNSNEFTPEPILAPCPDPQLPG